MCWSSAGKAGNDDQTKTTTKENTNKVSWGKHAWATLSFDSGSVVLPREAPSIAPAQVVLAACPLSERARRGNAVRAWRMVRVPAALPIRTIQSAATRSALA
jgi:hypothetical protein